MSILNNHRAEAAFLTRTLLTVSLAAVITGSRTAYADAESGKTIAPLKADVPYVFVVHQGRSFRVERDVYDSFRARPNIRGSLIQNAQACPPLCLQPMRLDSAVETWGEVEIVDFMLSNMRDKSGSLVDIRNRRTYDQATIPGSEHWYIQDMQKQRGSTAFDNMLETFGARRHDGIPLMHRIKSALGIIEPADMTEEWDFSEVRTLVIWGGSPMEKATVTAIEILLDAGYPAHRIKWYRGGLASWQYWGFNTVSKPD